MPVWMDDQLERTCISISSQYIAQLLNFSIFRQCITQRGDEIIVSRHRVRGTLDMCFNLLTIISDF